MRRRDIPMALMASATGSALLVRSAEAQTGTALSWPLTQAESAAGIKPANLAFPPGNVCRYGADPTGAVDSTPAFNAATFATVPYSLNGLLNEIVIPAGRFLVNGTVYVRKGQRVRGALGATYIVCKISGLGPTFKLGWGLIEGQPTLDPGGQPLSLESIFLLGGPAAGCIDFTTVAGGFLRDIFISAAAVGLHIERSVDLNISNVIFDQGATAIQIFGSANCQFDTLKFYSMNYDLSVGATTYDCQWANCHSEYNRYASILFVDGGSGICNLIFTNWQNVYNPTSRGHYTTFLGVIHNRATGVIAKFDSCTFYNMPGYAYVHGSETGSRLEFDSCTFDGAKTTAAYTVSTAAGAVDTLNETVVLRGCTFRNLTAPPVRLAGALPSSLEIIGGEYAANAGQSFISITNTSELSTLHVSGIRGDARQTLLNPQTSVAVSIRSCHDWFGPVAAGGPKRHVLVPYQFSNVYQVTLRANINPGGSPNYRKSIVLLAEKDNDRSAGARSFISTAIPIMGAANLNGAMAVAVEFGAVGGGTSIAESNSGWLAISWPGTYTSESVDVQMV